MSAARATEPRALRAGGGGGTTGNMEARVARLEAHVEILRTDSAATRSDVGDIRLDLATLTERVAHLPSKGFVVTSNMTAIALGSGVILFGEKLKALIGA